MPEETDEITKELDGTEEDVSLDEIQNILGASLTNLIDRCLNLPAAVKERDSQDEIVREATYIHDNARHVKQLMVRCQDMMNGLL